MSPAGNSHERGLGVHLEDETLVTDEEEGLEGLIRAIVLQSRGHLAGQLLCGR